MTPGFATDQYGERWIIFERGGNLWALGQDDEQEPIIRFLGKDGDGLNTDLTKPRGVRKLTMVEMAPRTPVIVVDLDTKFRPAAENDYEHLSRAYLQHLTDRTLPVLPIDAFYHWTDEQLAHSCAVLSGIWPSDEIGLSRQFGRLRQDVASLDIKNLPGWLSEETRKIAFRVRSSHRPEADS